MILLINLNLKVFMLSRRSKLGNLFFSSENKKKSNFSWKFVRLGSRTRSFTMLPAFGAWSLIHLPKKAWRAFYLPALSWPAPATTRSEFGTWILIWAPTPSTGGTFTATYKSTHLIEEISSERDKSLMSFVFVCLFFLTRRRIYSRPYT